MINDHAILMFGMIVTVPPINKVYRRRNRLDSRENRISTKVR